MRLRRAQFQISFLEKRSLAIASDARIAEAGSASSISDIQFETKVIRRNAASPLAGHIDAEAAVVAVRAYVADARQWTAVAGFSGPHCFGAAASVVAVLIGPSA